MMVVDVRADNPGNSFAPCQRMATAIADLMRKNGGCLPQDLLPLGFSKEETIELWKTAHVLAALEVKMLSIDA